MAIHHNAQRQSPVPTLKRKDRLESDDPDSKRRLGTAQIGVTSVGSTIRYSRFRQADVFVFAGRVWEANDNHVDTSDGATTIYAEIL
jgi:hypothetical protein